MSIKESLQKIKSWIELFYMLILILVIGSILWGLERIYALEQVSVPIKIEYGASSQRATLWEGGVIGSKSGKKYYFPWCGTVSRIKPENQVHFASITEARKAGFIPGGNCKGLK